MRYTDLRVPQVAQSSRGFSTLDPTPILYRPEPSSSTVAHAISSGDQTVFARFKRTTAQRHPRNTTGGCETWRRFLCTEDTATNTLPRSPKCVDSTVRRLHSWYRLGYKNGTTAHAVSTTDQTAFAGFQRIILLCQLQHGNDGSGHKPHRRCGTLVTSGEWCTWDGHMGIVPKIEENELDKRKNNRNMSQVGPVLPCPRRVRPFVFN